MFGFGLGFGFGPPSNVKLGCGANLQVSTPMKMKHGKVDDRATKDSTKDAAGSVGPVFVRSSVVKPPLKPLNSSLYVFDSDEEGEAKKTPPQPSKGLGIGEWARNYRPSWWDKPDEPSH